MQEHDLLDPNELSPIKSEKTPTNPSEVTVFLIQEEYNLCFNIQLYSTR